LPKKVLYKGGGGMNHTPGPWYVTNTGNDQGLIVDENIGDNIAITYDARNADLVASAPDLLTALETMISAFNANQIDPLIAFAAIEKARSAIDKAKGKL